MANRPNWFNFEKCFKNLLDTMPSPSECKLHVVFDGDPSNHFVQKYKKDYLFTIAQINGGNSFVSNQLAYEYIKQQNIEKDDLIYIVEWDYLHLNNWCSSLMDLYFFNPNRNINNTYISLYNHPDKYYFRQPEHKDHWSMYWDLKSAIYITNYGYWVEVPSTCNSFVMKKSLFDKDYDILSLPKADNERFPRLIEKGRSVLQAMPGLATHCDRIFITPFIDWNSINQNTIIYD